MKKIKVIHAKRFPARPPVLPTIVWGLLLDRLKAPGWAWGIYGTLMVIVWILWGFAIFAQETFDPWEKHD